jgi:hypothetical protein
VQEGPALVTAARTLVVPGVAGGGGGGGGSPLRAAHASARRWLSVCLGVLGCARVRLGPSAEWKRLPRDAHAIDTDGLRTRGAEWTRVRVSEWESGGRCARPLVSLLITTGGGAAPAPHRPAQLCSSFINLASTRWPVLPPSVPPKPPTRPPCRRNARSAIHQSSGLPESTGSTDYSAPFNWSELKVRRRRVTFRQSHTWRGSTATFLRGSMRKGSSNAVLCVWVVGRGEGGGGGGGGGGGTSLLMRLSLCYSIPSDSHS